MLLKGEQLSAHLERELRPLYVLYGDEPLLVLEAADQIRAKARQRAYTEREVLTVLPQFDWGQLLAAGGNLSLFGDRKLIDLRIPGGKPGKESSAALQQWCQHINSDNLLLVDLLVDGRRRPDLTLFPSVDDFGRPFQASAATMPIGLQITLPTAAPTWTSQVPAPPASAPE